MDDIEKLLQQQAAMAANQPDEVEALLLQQATKAQAPTPPESKNKTAWQPLGSFGNLLYGAAKGTADLVQAPAQIALNAANSVAQRVAPASGITNYIGDKNKQFNQYLADQERQYQEETPGSISAGVGRVVSNAAPFVATGGGAAPGVLAKLLQGAGMSAVSQPVNDVVTEDNGQNNFFAEKGLQAAFGAGGSLLGMGAGKVLGGLVDPAISKEAKAALDEGITPTIGQMLGGKVAALENKLTSAPFVGEMIKSGQRGTTEDFNRAAYSRVLKLLGDSAEKLPIGYEGVAAVKGKLANAYDSVLSKVNFRGDQQFGDDLINIGNMVNNGNVPQQIASQFNSILQNNVLSRMTKGGTMDGKQYKLVESDLSNRIKSFAGSQDPSQRELGTALGAVKDALNQSLSRSNPQHAEELSKVNQAYSNYARVRAAASGTGAQNGIFTPAQLASAVRNLDKSAGKGASATGTALMQDLVNVGKNVAPTYPDSGTAGRIWELGTVAGLLAQPQYTIPAVAGGALAAAPYTTVGKKIVAQLLTKRPESAPQVANALQNVSPALGSVLANSAVPLSYPNFNNGR